MATDTRTRGFAIAFHAALLIACARCQATSTQSNDDTLSPEASGSAVVEAVCARLEASCIFADDKLFIRRLAYVESADGTDPNTYRQGYFGGIWQVDRSMFDATQSSSTNVVLLPYIKKIQQAFGIDWPSVKWSDLTKPLYSALAARLYLQVKILKSLPSLPRAIADQAAFWQTNYRPDGTIDDFVGATTRLEPECSGVGVDLIFVIDDSGSIGAPNFKSVKNFVKSVVGSLEIGPTMTRVGFIKFSTKVQTEFQLNTYTTQKDVLAAIDRIQYGAGGTNTHLALTALTTDGFVEANGARPVSAGHPRVAVVMTDGKSNQPRQTVLSALNVHAADITVIAVGVGDAVDVDELEVIASDPVCLHMTLLKSFTEVDSLKYVIQRRSCSAPIIFSPSQNVTKTGKVKAGTSVNCKLLIPDDGMTVQVFTSAGESSFYISRSSYPSSSYYEQMVSATPDTPGVLYVAQPQATIDDEGLVFCNIQGDVTVDVNLTITIDCDSNTCRKHPCKNGAICIDLHPGYICKCRPGFTGRNCEIDINECSSNPCLNGGSCQDLVNGWQCQCPPGWTGTNCGDLIDNCSPGICNHGSCSSIPEGYVCTCDPGYTGSDCSTIIDTCDPNPCNNGACINTYDGGFQCNCYDGYTGAVCDVDIDECASQPCVNGQCVDQVDGYECQCNPGYSGLLCDIDIDECASNPCVNGQCTDGVNQWTCDCEPGWTDATCSTDIDECSSNPCATGTCVDIVDGYRCNCEAGYSGINCEQPIDECSSSPCVNGDCKPLLNGFECCCNPGYNGQFCENEIDECSSNPCVNGQCINGPNSYTCVCSPGYTGIACEIDIDECDSNPCINGDCEDLINGYECNCLPGWTGSNCGTGERVSQPMSLASSSTVIYLTVFQAVTVTAMFAITINFDVLRSHK